jgi:predicted nucleic acid-binding protein
VTRWPRLTGMAWCVTFVTVGKLWQWATTRSWASPTREDLELWLGRVVVLNSDDATARTWAGSRRRLGAGTSAANDSWIAACCLAHQFPLATFNVKDFEDFAEHNALQQAPGPARSSTGASCGR